MKHPHTLLLLATLALWLVTTQAKGQEFQHDAFTAANWQALIDTARALAKRGTISQQLVNGTEQHRPNRDNLFAKYDKTGQGAAFCRLAGQYLDAQRAALKAIFATEKPLRQPSGFPAAVGHCRKPSSPLYGALTRSIPSPVSPPRSKSPSTP